MLFRSTKSSYTFRATVSDGKLSVNRDIIITVTNEPEAPILSAFSQSIKDDIGLGTKIGKITFDKGDSNIKSFTLSGDGNTYFKITNDGNVTTNTNFKDKDKDKDPSTSTIKITSLLASINEDIAIGTEVGRITVEENEDTIDKSFALDDTTSFKIDNTGMITTNTTFDYENGKREYNLTVTATNAKDVSAQAHVIITIKNVAEIPPTIEAKSSAIDEGMPIGTKVGEVKVLKIGDTDIYKYELNDATNFTIDKTGKIITKIKVNFEEIKEYNLTVYAMNETGFYLMGIMIHDRCAGSGNQEPNWKLLNLALLIFLNAYTKRLLKTITIF